jgi:DNA-binding GntR family transcriptional regulator
MTTHPNPHNPPTPPYPDDNTYRLYTLPTPRPGTSPHRRIRIEFIGRRPTPDEATHLHLDPRTPVIVLNRTIYDHTGTAIKHTQTISPGPNTVLMHTYPLDAPPTTGRRRS